MLTEFHKGGVNQWRERKCLKQSPGQLPGKCYLGVVDGMRSQMDR